MCKDHHSLLAAGETPIRSSIGVSEEYNDNVHSDNKNWQVGFHHHQPDHHAVSQPPIVPVECWLFILRPTVREGDGTQRGVPISKLSRERSLPGDARTDVDCLWPKPMQLQRIRVLGLRPEQLDAKLLIAFHAHNSTQLPRPDCSTEVHIA